MKLRNKKTGEIVELRDLEQIRIPVEDKNGEWYEECYDSIAELNEEWEDYDKECETYFYITMNGFIGEAYINKFLWNTKDTNERKEIGNYFETKEEAEKAVEKLKAWKRLKDARLKFTDFGYNLDELSSSTIGADGKICFEMMCYEDFADDLELLFGGEE